MSTDLRNSLVALAEKLGVEPFEGECRVDDIVLSWYPDEYDPFKQQPSAVPPPSGYNRVPVTQTYDPTAEEMQPLAAVATPEPLTFRTTNPNGEQQLRYTGEALRINKPREPKRYSLAEILNAMLDRVDCVNSVRAWNCDPKVDNNGRS